MSARLVAMLAIGFALLGGEHTASGGIIEIPDFVVNTIGDGSDTAIDGTCDSGILPGEQCTLRAAIQETNATVLGANILFNISGGGVRTITPATPLPAITKPVFIDGYSQPGSAPNTLGPGEGTDATPLIQIELEDLPEGNNGLVLDGGNSTVQGLIMSDATGNVGVVARVNGIRITSDNNEVLGNFLGTDASGTFFTVLLNGIYIAGGDQNQIGSADPPDRNLITTSSSGGTTNGNGIRIDDGDGNTVTNNLIGTDRTGMLDIGQGSGLRIGQGSANNVVGGSLPEERNVISGNGIGILVAEPGTIDNHILGNFIGVAADGINALSNGAGVLVLGANETRIGDSDSSEGVCDNGCNVISGNVTGVDIASDSSGNVLIGNHIGSDLNGNALGNEGIGVAIRLGAAGNSMLGNEIVFNGETGVLLWGDAGSANWILSNRIHSNAELGIDIIQSGTSPDGPNPNDPLDADTGPNDLLNAPALTSATTGSTRVTGTMQAVPNLEIDLQWFYSEECDPSGFGEGAVLFGYTDLPPDPDGDIQFDVTLTESAPVGSFVTAIAHAMPLSGPGINTSEFSNCVEAEGPVTPTPSPSPTGATASPTPTPSGPTPTGSATPTSTVTPTPGGETLVWGDNNCVDGPNPVDALLALRFDAGLPAETGDCPEMGEEVDIGSASLHLWGDIDCSGAVDPVDGLKLLRFDAGLSVAKPEDCPDAGDEVAIVS